MPSRNRTAGLPALASALVLTLLGACAATAPEDGPLNRSGDLSGGGPAATATRAEAPSARAAPRPVAPPGPSRQPAEQSGSSLAALPPDSEVRGAQPAERVTETFSGLASWYGKRFHGRLTASGSRFDMNAMTAAHRSLPFGTRVRVTNESNRRSIVVTINDRGPFIKPRIIDLSFAAAKALDFIDDGLTRVRVEVLAEG
ncbi:septal ring lytic transglycosylase RlpA family protein [Pelagibius sp.]|uniref:septal ring lytic transglycosylase RlpA family protein n=1 Tax=Pelagibius sp. TaxID=1931238 RepID=UPI002623B84F|nr:septal ring lytic transglycosylase RlpA family protein [Pelagibius sp.]